MSNAAWFAIKHTATFMLLALIVVAVANFMTERTMGEDDEE